MKRNARYGKLSCECRKITVEPVVSKNRFRQVLVVNTGKYDTMINNHDCLVQVSIKAKKQ